jgi:hypothetical protein
VHGKVLLKCENTVCPSAAVVVRRTTGRNINAADAWVEGAEAGSYYPPRKPQATIDCALAPEEIRSEFLLLRVDGSCRTYAMLSV